LTVHCERAPVAAPLRVIGVALPRQPMDASHPDVPALVTTLIREVVARGIDEEGLYRIAGARLAPWSP
jgi:hypothetical protein